MLRQVIVGYGNVACGMAWYRSHVMAKLVKFGLGVECYGSHVVEVEDWQVRSMQGRVR